MRLKIQFAALATLTVLAGSLASTAYTRDATRVVSYACPSGELFTVEFMSDHVRLRTGAGIFALAHDPAAPKGQFSDGQTTFHQLAHDATLERSGLAPASGCRPKSAKL